MARIPLFPLDVVVFPGEPFDLHVFEGRYLQMVEEALAKGLPLGIALARQDPLGDPVGFEPEPVGTAVRVLSARKVGNRYLLQVVGVRRFLVLEVHSDKPYPEASVVWLDDPPGDLTEAEQLAHRVLEQVDRLGGRIGWDAHALKDPVAVSHAVAATLHLDVETKQRLLEAQDATERLKAEADLLRA